MIRNSGEEPRIIEYQKTPPSLAELMSLIERMVFSVRDLLRQKETPTALDLLERLQRGAFSKEDDETIINAAGQRGGLSP